MRSKPTKTVKRKAKFEEYKPRDWIKFNSNFKLTPKQEYLFDVIKENEMTFVTGPAGSAKSITSCYTALKMLNDGLVDRIVLCKPLETSGEVPGILPGTLEEKIAPFIESFICSFEKIIDKQCLDGLLKSNHIVFKPFAYLRGVTFTRSFVIADEVQNLDFRQFMLLVTRYAEGSKLIMAGDISQYDIKENQLAFLKFIEMLIGVEGGQKGIEGIEHFEFDRSDIMRAKILIEITDRYEKFKAEGKMPKLK